MASQFGGGSMSEVATTRRDFLMMAGMGAGATLVHPSALFAEVGHLALIPKTILVPASGHGAMMSAAKILAKKLGLDDSVIQTYDGAPKATKGAIVLALAKDGKLTAAEMPKVDGYTVTYTGGAVGGIMVWGARPRSLLYAAGEPHHWLKTATAPYRRNPEFALRNTTWHADYPVAEQAAMFEIGRASCRERG